MRQLATRFKKNWPLRLVTTETEPAHSYNRISEPVFDFGIDELLMCEVLHTTCQSERFLDAEGVL